MLMVTRASIVMDHVQNNATLYVQVLVLNMEDIVKGPNVAAKEQHPIYKAQHQTRLIRSFY